MPLREPLCGFEICTGGLATVGEAMANVQRDLGWTDADFGGFTEAHRPSMGLLPAGCESRLGIENVATSDAARRKRKRLQVGADYHFHWQ
jgi:hypothetical protein